MSPELEKIKKKYGENLAHLCRTFFANILEQQGKLLEILEESFAESRSLYQDLISQKIELQFKDYVYNKFDEKKEKKEEKETRTPYEILEYAGYELFECKTEEVVQNFSKWYEKDEELCTIYNGGRLEKALVFWAIKKNAKEIKREDFEDPKREDEYSTSVLGIQFDKHGYCSPHIISRYNHTVNNPNATYGNHLNKIAEGLEESFKILLQERELELNKSNSNEFELRGYTVGPDGKYYKYNLEIDGVYYCENNVVIDHGRIT